MALLVAKSFGAQSCTDDKNIIVITRYEKGSFQDNLTHQQLEHQPFKPKI